MPQNLPNLQTQFKQGILYGETAILAEIENFAHISPSARLGIYKNNTFVSLKACLLSTFEYTAEIISIEFFRYLSDEFIRQQPPTSGCLMDYGSDFPEFIRTFDALKDHTYLHDFAKLEWYMQKSLNAQKTAPLEASDLASLDEDFLLNHVFKCQEHIHIIQSEYAIFSLFKYLRENQENGVTSGLPHDFDLYRAENTLILQNNAGGTEVLNISPAYYMFIKSCMEGQTFEKAVDHMAPFLVEDENFEQIFSQTLQLNLFTQMV